MLTIRDYENNEYPLLSVKTVNQELNGQHDIELLIPQQRNNNLDLKKIDKLWEIDYQTVTYKIMFIKQITRGNSFYLEVKAIPLFYWDMDKQIIHENKDGHYTAQNAFKTVFEGSGYDFTLVDFAESIEIEGFGKGETRLEMFKRLIERFGYEFEIVGTTVYMKKLIGNDTNFMYKYKLNTSNVTRSIDSSSYFTHIKGFGNFEDGSEDYLKDAKLKREYTSPLAKVLGHFEGKPIIDGRVKDKDTLDKTMKKAVDNSLEISIDGTLHDVREIYKQAVPVIGDRVFLIDERIGLEQEIRIHTLKKKFDVRDSLIDCEVTFGSQNIRDRYKSNLNSAARDFTALMSGDIKLPTWSLDEIARGMITKIHASENELRYGDFGIQAVDKNNPNNVTGLNSQGWYISTDGGRTARTIATAEGIVADAITTGTLRSIYIEGVEIYGSKIYGAEIKGGTITGGTLYTDADNDHYISLRGSELISRGVHRREWFGDVSNDNVKIMISNGQIRARNDRQEWSLYFNDMGISTFADGDGNGHPGGNASGAIEFHSPRYSGGAFRGMTILSHGRLALESANENGARIYLNPNGAHVHVADASDNYYGISASTFSQSSQRSLKRNIKNFDDDASSIIKNLKIKEYKRLTRGKIDIFDQWQVGLIVDEAPRQVLANGDSVDLYSFTSILAKSQQETMIKDGKRDANIERLSKELKKLKEQINNAKT